MNHLYCESQDASDRKGHLIDKKIVLAMFIDSFGVFLLARIVVEHNHEWKCESVDL